MATIRNLKIKTSTCKRIVKELDSYKKEVEREAAKTASMKDAGADPYDIKQQVWGFPVFLFLVLFEYGNLLSVIYFKENKIGKYEVCDSALHSTRILKFLIGSALFYFIL